MYAAFSCSHSIDLTNTLEKAGNTQMWDMSNWPNPKNMGAGLAGATKKYGYSQLGTTVHVMMVLYKVYDDAVLSLWVYTCTVYIQPIMFCMWSNNLYYNNIVGHSVHMPLIEGTQLKTDNLCRYSVMYGRIVSSNKSVIASEDWNLLTPSDHGYNRVIIVLKCRDFLAQLTIGASTSRLQTPPLRR